MCIIRVVASSVHTSEWFNLLISCQHAHEALDTLHMTCGEVMMASPVLDSGFSISKTPQHSSLLMSATERRLGNRMLAQEGTRPDSCDASEMKEESMVHKLSHFS